MISTILESVLLRSGSPAPWDRTFGVRSALREVAQTDRLDNFVPTRAAYAAIVWHVHRLAACVSGEFRTAYLQVARAVAQVAATLPPA
jgi:hypothetical protein